jgi:hypothetical protein
MAPESGKLEKLRILAYATPDYSGSPVGQFDVYYNPDEYVQLYDLEYDEKSADGATASPMKFKRIKPREYSIKFLIDGTGASGDKIDVPLKIMQFYETIGYDGEQHRPRYLWVLWGVLSSRCVLLKAEITYTLFRPDGIPIRAVINASFKENVDDTTRALKENKKSPDRTRVREVKEGDRLPLLAYQIYGDPAHYLEVARSNRLNNFRKLSAGSRLIFYPIAKG